MQGEGSPRSAPPALRGGAQTGEQGEKAREEKKWGSESGFKLSMVAGAANSDLEGGNNGLNPKCI